MSNNYTGFVNVSKLDLSPSELKKLEEIVFKSSSVGTHLKSG